MSWLRLWMRRGGFGLAGVAALGGVALTALVTHLDTVPWFRADYGRDTVARLHNARTDVQVQVGDLRAGFGRSLLTPRFVGNHVATNNEGVALIPLAGYGARQGEPATGVLQDLWVKAVAFQVGSQRVVMVSADALIIPREVADEARSLLAQDPGFAWSEVYFGATHTHGSVGGWGQGWVAEAFAGPHIPEVRPWFARQLAAAARAAWLNLKPASLGHGRVAIPEFVRNRLVGDQGRIDPDFSYVLIRQKDGDRAMIGSYAAHATVLSPKVMEFHGDYPGRWQEQIEDAPGTMALFLAGGVGSHSPRPGASGREGMKRMGDQLATRLAQEWDECPTTNRIAFGTLGLVVDLPSLHVRLSDSLRLRPTWAKRLLPVSPHTTLQAVRLDQQLWVATPCDFSGELALERKDFARARGADLAVTSFNGDYIGYVIPSRYYHLNGYEPRTMSFFGPEIPDYFMTLARSMTESLLLGRAVRESRHERDNATGSP